MDQQKIQNLLTELDALVPKEGAKVVLRQYGGGPDEGMIRANPAGYLRLGLELMKGAFVPPTSAENPHRIWINLEGIVSDSSDIGFDVFDRTEDAEEQKFNYTFRHRITAYAVGIFLFAIPVLAVVGVISLLMMIF